MKKMLPQLKCYYHPGTVLSVERDSPRMEAVFKVESLAYIKQNICHLNKFKNIKLIKTNNTYIW